MVRGVFIYVKIKFKINCSKYTIIMNALVEFGNKLIVREKYTDCIDKLILKINK